ncbi:MAG: phosphoglycerate dehydrogenase [Youngiibacter sp.]|nr:phosphoglycerate dehydrogenase [Youngiibacter sp.]
MKVLVTPTSFRSKTNTKAMEKLKGFADEIVFNESGKPLTAKDLQEMLKGCDGYIAGLDFIDEVALESADDLKVISRYGAGYDRVNMKAANDRGIIVTNTPGSNATAVADLAFGLILSVARRIPMLDASTKSGEWIRSTGMELSGKTIGIMGLGAIGKNVAQRAKGFSMKVLAYDPFMDEEYAKSNDIIPSDLDELIRNSDVISLHLPLNDKTKDIISYKEFESMKEKVILINTSRGGLINEEASVEYLKNGKLGGLGLDAFEEEPTNSYAKFRFDNVVLTPHTGAHTFEATENMANMAVDNLIDVLRGADCRYIINKQVKEN